MNYHIFPQNKFFDAYIEDIYKLHQEKNNVFWVRGNKGDSDLLKTERPVTYIGNDETSIIEKLRSIRSQDKLIVSWYDTFIGECILSAKTTCCVYAYLMGGDFYNDPFGYHNFWLYDSCTKKIIDKIYSPQINFHRRPKNWYKILNEIQCKKKYKSELIESYNRKLKTIARIDYIITGANNEAEICFVKKLFPTFRAKYIHGSFDQNFDLAKDLPPKDPYSGDQMLQVLLGNSADPSNNHIDACNFLLKALPKDSIVNCPLSYGDPDYSVIFQKWAETNLQSRFHPVKDFLSRKEYVELLNNMDLVIMYHNRQQAIGNIITSLCLGKPIFIKRHSPVFLMLTSMKVPNVFSLDMLNPHNIATICKDAHKNRAQVLSIIQNCYSEQARLNDLKKIIM